ncbi:hypothetical protein EVAR_45870_1 [Eumeta japonica]|uniref:Uncharacterized protein n=1 Tax=Eumeta variegata TaxID=151549 RepID=A0A4C1WME4_EUMVA|nr:hypothetical protein EVAR_45870_1 [Eumeta japonica]
MIASDPDVASISTCFLFNACPNRNKRACEPPESRWPPPPMDIRNSSEVTIALLPSWIGIGYLIEEESG